MCKFANVYCIYASLKIENKRVSYWFVYIFLFEICFLQIQDLHYRDYAGFSECLDLFDKLVSQL